MADVLASSFQQATVFNPGVKSGNINSGHTLDPAPTILILIDEHIPSDKEGKVLPIFKG